MHPGSFTLVEMDPRVIFLRTNKIGSGPLAIALFHVMARGRGGGYKIISYFDFSLSPPGHSSVSCHGQGAWGGRNYYTLISISRSLAIILFHVMARGRGGGET